MKMMPIRFAEMAWQICFAGRNLSSGAGKAGKIQGVPVLVQ